MRSSEACEEDVGHEDGGKAGRHLVAVLEGIDHGEQAHAGHSFHLVAIAAGAASVVGSLELQEVEALHEAIVLIRHRRVAEVLRKGDLHHGLEVALVLFGPYLVLAAELSLAREGVSADRE